MDWLDLLAVQGILKSLLNTSSKESILWSSAFFIFQLSLPYMTTGKTIALTRWTFVDKVMSLLFNMLSRLVITFLPRSKHLLISWLQSPSAVVILQPPKIKSASVGAPEQWRLRSPEWREELPHIQGHPMYRAVAALCWSSHEEIPHVQGKRNPRKMIGAERGHQRADRLKPQSQTTSQSDHTDHSLFHSMKLSHAVWAPLQDGQVMVERSDRMWTTGEGNGKPLKCSCLENPMNSPHLSGWPKSLT